MAIFHLPEQGAKAAIQIQRHLTEFNKTSGEHLVLKIGLYSGPVIAVNSNDRLDYFGRTVNIASRIQSQGVGNDIILSRDYMNQDNVQALFTHEEVDLTSFQTVLKGIKGDMELMRATLKGRS